MSEAHLSPISAGSITRQSDARDPEHLFAWGL
jgi:hypothetical protein